MYHITDDTRSRYRNLRPVDPRSMFCNPSVYAPDVDHMLQGDDYHEGKTRGIVS